MKFKFPHLLLRIQGYYIRAVAEHLFKSSLKMYNTVPYISFTFDDFPRSALHTGGEILRRYGLRATYYASLGLIGTEGKTGRMLTRDDLYEAFAQGHELGCHTFDHYHSWNTKPRRFEDSIIKNKRTLADLIPEAVFKSLSYPMLGPRPVTKLLVRKYFRCCRGGGQKFNKGTVDSNYLRAFFLEKKRDNLRFVKDVIDQCCRFRGWLIFATHDVSETPSPYGCTPFFFEDVVRYSLASGSRILPLAEVYDIIAQSPMNDRI
jgi:peptidoglycan/xylan/chitin deacetylase (PgdA/CDA1 family)